MSSLADITSHCATVASLKFAALCSNKCRQSEFHQTNQRKTNKPEMLKHYVLFLVSPNPLKHSSSIQKQVPSRWSGASNHHVLQHVLLMLGQDLGRNQTDSAITKDKCIFIRYTPKKEAYNISSVYKYVRVPVHVDIHIYTHIEIYMHIHSP